MVVGAGVVVGANVSPEAAVGETLGGAAVAGVVVGGAVVGTSLADRWSSPAS